MKKISIFSITTLLVILTLMTAYSESEAQTTVWIKEVITQSNKKYIEWFNSGQIDSLANLYDKEACLEGRGCGKEFIRDYFTGESTQYKFHELLTSNVTVNDNVAIETGSWKVRLTTGTFVSGNYTSEWRLVDNRWVIFKESTTTTME